MSHPAGPPAMRVVRGEPSDEELAALVMALRSRPAVAVQGDPPSAWTRRDDLLRKPLFPGAGAWRAAVR